MSKFPEGPFQAKITAVEFTANNRKNASPDDFNIAISLKDEHGNTDCAYLEVSQSYGNGPMSGKTQLQITLDTLAGIGWPKKFGVANATDFVHLDKLVGTDVDGNAKDTQKEGAEKGVMKTYHNVYLGRATLPKDDIARRMKALTGQAVAGPERAQDAAPAGDNEIF